VSHDELMSMFAEDKGQKAAVTAGWALFAGTLCYEDWILWNSETQYFWPLNEMKDMS